MVRRESNKKHVVLPHHTGLYEICWVIWKSNIEKETKSREGMQHHSSQSDWSLWRCNGRRYNKYKCVIVCLHSLDRATSGLFFPWTKSLSKCSKQISGMSPCLSSLYRPKAVICIFFDWPHAGISHPQRPPFGSQSESIAFCPCVSWKPKHKCILCFVSTTWLLE